MNTENLDTKLDILLTKVSALEKTSTDLKSTIINSNKKFLDEEELLIELDISRATVYRLEKSGKLKAYRLNGKGSKKYFKREEVYALLESGIAKK